MNSQLFAKRLFFMIFSGTAMQYVVATLPDCTEKSALFFHKTVCKSDELKDLNHQIKEKYLNAQLMSNAPLKLLENSQHAWEQYVKQCKTQRCIKEQFEQRIDDLTFFTTMNQSLTQHFIRYKNARVDTQITHIQLQQLDRNRIKIEGVQYRNPNNSEAARMAYLRSYTSPDSLTDISDLESKCTYTLERTAHILTFSSKDNKCQRFVGIYKLYD